MTDTQQLVVLPYESGDQPDPSDIPADLGHVSHIAAGWWSVAARRCDGTVAGWGGNWGRPPDDLGTVKSIAVGRSHGVALLGNGTVVAWGDNSNGQTEVPADLDRVSAIAANGDFSIALRSDGTVVAWGQDAFGETTIPRDLRDVVGIAVGANTASPSRTMARSRGGGATTTDRRMSRPISAT